MPADLAAEQTFAGSVAGRLARLGQHAVEPAVRLGAIVQHGWARRAAARPMCAQERLLRRMVSAAGDTEFGRAHGFGPIRSYDDFRRQVPLADYESLRPYIERLKDGARDVLWPGRPVAFAYTSGTTSAPKYIPVTRASIRLYSRTVRDAVCAYVAGVGSAACLAGRQLAFIHNIEVERFCGVPVGPIAGIIQAHLPFYYRRRFLPSAATSRLADFERKVELSVEETVGQDVSMISGLPPWIQLYFNRLTARTGRRVREVFPNFSLLLYYGVNIRPYRTNLETSIGGPIDTLEMYGASEGILAYQDTHNEAGLLLNLRGGLFYEFIPLTQIASPRPDRLSLAEVDLDTEYVPVLSSPAGLWGYVIGDTVRFVSRDPYRLVVTGRTSQFLSATGEHLVAEDVEAALAELARAVGVPVVEFSVAPAIDPAIHLPFHEWYVEFRQAPADPGALAQRLDVLVAGRNINYAEFRQAGILLPLAIRVVRSGGFLDYMRARGRVGAFNKVPRLANDRRVAEALQPFLAGGE